MLMTSLIGRGQAMSPVQGQQGPVTANPSCHEKSQSWSIRWNCRSLGDNQLLRPKRPLWGHKNVQDALLL